MGLTAISWKVSKCSSDLKKSQEADVHAQSISVSSAITYCLTLTLIVFLFFLMLSILLESSLTGLLWWTSYDLGLKYKIANNCFCEVATEATTTENVVDLFGLNCPKSGEMLCSAVYSAVPVKMGGGLVMNTRHCQRTDGQGLIENCILFSTFWSWFKVWRIVLPLSILMKLPITLFFCLSFLSVTKRKKVVGQPIISYDTISSTVAWDNHHPLPSTVQVDPVQFYGNICAGLELRNIQEQVGLTKQAQAHALTILPSRPVTLRATAAMARYPSETLVPGPCPSPLTPVQCPVPPTAEDSDRIEHENVVNSHDYSPPDIQEHIISTPIESDKFTMTPQFDLSKVQKPTFIITGYEDISIQCKNPEESNNVPYKFDFEQKNSVVLRRDQSDKKCTTESFPIMYAVNDPSSLLTSHLVQPPPRVPLRTSSLSTPWHPTFPSKHGQSNPVASQSSKLPVRSSHESPHSQKSKHLLPAPPTRCSSISPQSCPIQGGMQERDKQASSEVLRINFVNPANANGIDDKSRKLLLDKHSQNMIHQPLVDFKQTPDIELVIEDPPDTDCDSSTCDSVHFTTPIIRKPSVSQLKTCRVWPLSPSPLRIQRGTSCAIATSPGTNIHEICKKARNMSQSSNVDWSKLP